MEMNNDNRVLIDSIRINNSQNLYWFKIESGIGSSSVSFISISKTLCEVNKTNALIKGDLIYQVNYHNDTIRITSRLGFKILRKYGKYKFINRNLEPGQKISRHIQKELPFSRLCK
jgi:hypothetical protein